MRKLLLLALGIFGLAVSAVRAQELPAADLSVGYSYIREGFSNGVNDNGGTAAFHRIRQPLARYHRGFRRVSRFPVWRQRKHIHVPGRTAFFVSAFRTRCAVCTSFGGRGSSYRRREWHFRLD